MQPKTGDKYFTKFAAPASSSGQKETQYTVLVIRQRSMQPVSRYLPRDKDATPVGNYIHNAKLTAATAAGAIRVSHNWMSSQQEEFAHEPIVIDRNVGRISLEHFWQWKLRTKPGHGSIEGLPRPGTSNATLVATKITQETHTILLKAAWFYTVSFHFLARIRAYKRT